MSESLKGSNYLFTPKRCWLLLVWFGGQHKNPFWDLCLNSMINEKNIVNSNCCGLNWAFLIVLPLWWVQEMFTESTDLALIHHMSPFGYQRSVIWAGREIAGFHPLGPDSDHPQQWCGSTRLSVLMTSLTWAMKNTCRANRNSFHRGNSTGFTTLYDLRATVARGAVGDAMCAHTRAARGVSPVTRGQWESHSLAAPVIIVFAVLRVKEKLHCRKYF